MKRRRQYFMSDAESTDTFVLLLIWSEREKEKGR